MKNPEAVLLRDFFCSPFEGGQRSVSLSNCERSRTGPGGCSMLLARIYCSHGYTARADLICTSPCPLQRGSPCDLTHGLQIRASKLQVSNL